MSSPTQGRLGIRIEEVVGTVFSVLLHLQKFPGEPWTFHRKWNWDWNLSYLDLKGSGLPWLTKDEMER